MSIFRALVFTVLLALFAGCSKDDGPWQSVGDSRLGNAFVEMRGDNLAIGTGEISREFAWTERGLVSASVSRDGNKAWASEEPLPVFGHPTWADAENPAVLKSVSVEKSDDEGFTSRHLELVVETEYPKLGLLAKYKVWAYPNTPGLRTQLWFKLLPGTKLSENALDGVVAEAVAVGKGSAEWKAVGYYNDTQHRNMAETEILREENSNGEADWASVYIGKRGNEGLALVKESHKCVNQQGVNTGVFAVVDGTLQSTGVALTAKNLNDFEYRQAWANWIVLFEGGEAEEALAIKRFDRARYPVDAERDIYIMANTWGSGSSGEISKYASRQENIFREIDSQKDLGIDVQQIDDGWQGKGYGKWRPVRKLESKVVGAYDVFPKGWEPTRQYYKTNGIRPGLWAAWSIPLEDLKWNYDKGGFLYYKLDFAKLYNYETLDGFISKVRNFIKYTKHNVRVNWDVTENPPRIGYFYGREYGNIYLENRKPQNPPNVLYHPYLVLRDAWQTSKYLNLNKYQISVQNIDRVNRELSDAYLHNHPYSVALTLMGSPIFFQETHRYTDKARDEIRKLLAEYKLHRKEMYDGYVFPVGAKPDNSSWTGFQNYLPSDDRGYLTIFRELNNENRNGKIKLNFLGGKKIKITDLIKKTSREVTVGKDGAVDFEIADKAGFLFCEYEVI
ncbi:hypothetical protein FUAX_26320 [Fulvitalea axinellae]|uniref:Alpha-galactosidase n=1 Tax=Fulvitalea axinellae TaxID=1182444 RepID=A0AAU9DCQ5_9BACT|nr:hypothetical protein FUAX_26320 [Fulvitalea axinellae]